MSARRHSLQVRSGGQFSIAFGCLVSLGCVACTHPPASPVAANVASEPQAAATAESAPTVPASAVAGESLPGGALPPLPGRGEVRVGDAEAPVFRVELAKNAEERAQGLMYRRRLAEDAGMVFDMQGTGRWAFWMKNTWIPLDMIFLDSEWRVVCVVANVPPRTLESRGCDVDSRWVLELASGHAARHAIAIGTRMRFRALPDAGAAQVTP